jgi:hypothetical protein
MHFEMVSKWPCKVSKGLIIISSIFFAYFFAAEFVGTFSPLLVYNCFAFRFCYVMLIGKLKSLIISNRLG